MLSTVIFRNTYKGPEHITITSDTTVFVGRCGSGLTVFGERAYLTKILKRHLVFTTESGAIVKTDFDAHTVGKAFKEHYFVALRDMTNEEHVMHHEVSYWNNKKCCFEYK